MTGSVILTQPQLEECLAYWQRELRLQDWDIKLEFARRHVMETDASAQSQWWSLDKSGRIKMLDSHDYEGAGWVNPQDMESDLVHELLHCHLRSKELEIPESGSKHDALEVAIEMLTQALVRLKREAGQVQHQAVQYVIGSQPADGAGMARGEIKVS